MAEIGPNISTDDAAVVGAALGAQPPMTKRDMNASSASAEPMIVDSFAGGGGASTGIEMALGRSPDVAINHDAAALRLHQANHPDTLHLDSNIWNVDPLEVTGGRPLGLLWASPDCKHHSKAKGGAPKDRNIRDLAWVVVRWARFAKPDVILLENVEEFRQWGPLDDDGKAIEGLQGVIFEQWVKALRDAGYKVQFRELRACDYGAPTIRRRFFMVARRDGRPIVWPKPTHGDPTSNAVRKGRLQPWLTAAECIDWSLPCPSIFDTRMQIREKHGLAANRPLADATMARVARGMKRYVLDAATPFVVNLTHGGEVEPPDVPIWTITGASRRGKATGTPFLSHLYGSNTAGGAGSIDLPASIVTAAGQHHAIVAPTLIQTGYGERGGQQPRSLALKAPLGTIVAGGVKHALASATLIPWITYGQQGGMNRSTEHPHHTITAGGKDTNGATTAFLAQQNNDPKRLGGVNPGRAANEPMSTITGTGSHQTPVVGWLAKYYGTEQDPRCLEPLHTITTRHRFGQCAADLVVPPFNEAMHGRAREVADFLRSHGVWEGGEFVTLGIEGCTYVIADIGLRMLSARELFRAQGFPDDYVIEGVWEELDGIWTFRSFTKQVQVSCVGNSVCPALAEALVSVNCQHMRMELAA